MLKSLFRTYQKFSLQKQSYFCTFSTKKISKNIYKNLPPSTTNGRTRFLIAFSKSVYFYIIVKKSAHRGKFHNFSAIFVQKISKKYVFLCIARFVIFSGFERVTLGGGGGMVRFGLE